MRYDPPPLEVARLVKGEYFTRIDVACPTCDAPPGVDCTTVRCYRRNCCACEGDCGGRPVQWCHQRRSSAWERWIRKLDDLKAIKRVPIPLGFPSVGHSWSGFGREHNALLIVKSAGLRPAKRKRRAA